MPTQVASRHVRTRSSDFYFKFMFSLTFLQTNLPIHEQNPPEISLIFSNVLTRILSRHVGAPTCQLSSPVDTLELDSIKSRYPRKPRQCRVRAPRRLY